MLYFNIILYDIKIATVAQVSPAVVITVVLMLGLYYKHNWTCNEKNIIKSNDNEWIELLNIYKIKILHILPFIH